MAENTHGFSQPGEESVPVLTTDTKPESTSDLSEDDGEEHRMQSFIPMVSKVWAGEGFPEERELKLSLRRRNVATSPKQF